MAKLEPGAIQFTGSIQNISAYKRYDSDRIILRTKGGPTKEQVDTLPAFEPTRKINKEFGGRSKAAKWIRKALAPLLMIADYNLSSALVSTLRAVQVLDNENENGKRNVLISRSQDLLAGFPINRRNPLEAVVRNSIHFTLSREEKTATLKMPQLFPSINFSPVANFPFYKWIGVLGVIPDIIFKGKGYIPVTNLLPEPCFVESDWLPVKEKADAFSMELSLKEDTIDTSCSLMLTLGISFGIIRSSLNIEPVQHAGAGKVIAVN
jgi:hypothetical protein